MAMKVARRPTTASWASMTIHFFSTSAGLSEAVVLVFMTSPGDGRSQGPRTGAAQVQGMALLVNANPPQSPEKQGVARCGIIIPYRVTVQSSVCHAGGAWTAP